jgi:hypothetical protein
MTGDDELMPLRRECRELMDRVRLVDLQADEIHRLMAILREAGARKLGIK